MWYKTLANLITYGMVLFIKYVYGYESKNFIELFRRLNRVRDLRFSLKCASFIYLYFKNPFRRTSEHNCSYNYLNLSFFLLEKVYWNMMLTFNQWIKARYGLLTVSGVEPHWRVWAANIVRKNRLMKRLKNGWYFCSA